jgi:hypothetical protein
MAAEVAKVRDAVGRAQAEFGAMVMQEFASRWEQACRTLAALRFEAQAISKVLGTSISCAPPYKASINPVHGNPEVRPIALAEPMEALTLPPALVKIGNVLDRLHSAAGLVGALAQSVQLNAQHHALARLRAGQQIEMVGMYEVAKPFSILGSDFAVGTLIDRSVMSDGLLYRNWLARNIRPLNQPGSAAVA